MTNAQGGAMSPYQSSLRGSLYQAQQSAARMAGSARGAMSSAFGKASAAFGAAKPFMPVAGGALAAVSAGFEAKNRLDRGEDAQRAATGAATGLAGTLAGGAKGAAIGSIFAPATFGLSTIVGGLAGAALGGFGAGYATDRVTDAVRGNDGKGTDAVLRDLYDQADKAKGEGNFSRAGQLMAEAVKFQQSRMPAGSQGANNYQMAQQAGVAQSDATEFGSQQSRQSMDKVYRENDFVQQFNFRDRNFTQLLGQKDRLDAQSSIAAERERKKIQAIAGQDESLKTQLGITAALPGMIQQTGIAYMQNVNPGRRGLS